MRPTQVIFATFRVPERLQVCATVRASVSTVPQGTGRVCAPRGGFGQKQPAQRLVIATVTAPATTQMLHARVIQTLKGRIVSNVSAAGTVAAACKRARQVKVQPQGTAVSVPMDMLERTAPWRVRRQRTVFATGTEHAVTSQERAHAAGRAPRHGWAQDAHAIRQRARLTTPSRSATSPLAHVCASPLERAQTANVAYLGTMDYPQAVFHAQPCVIATATAPAILRLVSATALTMIQTVIGLVAPAISALPDTWASGAIDSVTLSRKPQISSRG
jgi:hypothetical protein